MAPKPEPAVGGRRPAERRRSPREESAADIRIPTTADAHGTGDTAGARANRLPLYALLAASIVSLVGNTLTLVALPWFVLQTTGSPVRTGLTGFFIALPNFLAGLFGGTLVDRLGPKRVGIAADLVSGVGIVLIPALYLTVGLAFWQLLALVFLGATLDVPGLTARRALLPELATLARMPLERVNAAFEGLQYVAQLLGPPLAGLLIAALGASNVLWIDAATFAFSAALVAVAIPAATLGERPKAGRYLDDLLDGFRFLVRDRTLLALALGLTITNFLGAPLFAVLWPVYVRDTGGAATGLGLLAAAFGGGSLLGAVVYGAIGHRVPRRPIWIGAYMVEALPLWTLALTGSLPVILAVTALCATLGGPLSPLGVTIRHERTPPHLRGRVFGTFSALATAGSPLGMLAGGFALEGLGLRATLVAMGAAYLAVGTGMLFVPALRGMDRPAREPPAG